MTDDDPVRSYLKARCLNADRIGDCDLARALPLGARVPRWARAWSGGGHRLVVPLFDSSGKLRTVRVRQVGFAKGPKVLAPKGHKVAGTVMADPLSRLMLTNSHSTSDGEPADYVRKVGLWIAEGDVDFLTLCTLHSDADEDAPAVIGIFTGAFTPKVAARIPNHTTVTIWTDPDQAGDRYAAKIARLLGGRCRVRREVGR